MKDAVEPPHSETGLSAAKPENGTLPTPGFPSFDQTLFLQFQAAARQFSGETALIDYHTGCSTLYEDLLAQVNRLAVHLKETCGVRPGHRAGILTTNQIEFVVGFFALQAVGAVVIPLNYRLTATELGVIAGHAEMTGLIAAGEFEPQYQEILQTLHWFIPTDSQQGDTPAHESFQWTGDLAETPQTLSTQLPELNPMDLAVLIYTSGTTGRPKGVMLSHRNLLSDTAANIEAIWATRSDIFITASPLFHVFGLTNVLLSCLLSGGKLVLLRKFHPKSLLDAITQRQVTFLAAVPTMYQMMLTLLPGPYDLSSLRVCHSGAAPMHQAVWEQVEACFGAPVQESYGQSEASSIMTSNPLLGPRKPGSIGRPLTGVHMEIVDESDRPLPPGEVGELRAQGPTIMMGYWQNPEATARALRNSWLYTSDMGYQDGDGYIFLAGRRDDLINIGGTKVYPQEVEEVLYRYPGVQACAVKAESSALYHQIVSAYIVSSCEAPLNRGELLRFCRQSLAEYKIPKAVYFVSEIPKGPTGKILRHQLSPDQALS